MLSIINYEIVENVLYKEYFDASKSKLYEYVYSHP